MTASRVDRRRFLKTAAATAVAPYVITSTALGNATTPAASERVTLGHIGVGNQGGNLFRAAQRNPAAQSVAVADAYRDRRAAYARMIKGKAYGDFRDLLARSDIDAVIIATPDHWHASIAMAAARAKKDCYVEKPLSVSIEQDLACLKVFQETGRIFQYGTQQRSLPYCRFACELVRNGRIGKIQAIEVVAPNGGAGGSTKVVPVPANLDYEMWCGPAPVKPYTADRCHPSGTYWIYDYSIGYLGGWGAHPLDILVWGCDADLAGPLTVEGTGDIPTTGLYDTVYNWDMKIQLAGGVPMTFKSGGDSTKFIGSDGWVRVTRAGIDAEPKSLLREPIAPDEIHLDEDRTAIDRDHDSYMPLTRHGKNFVAAVKSRKPALSTIEHAFRSDTISLLCDIAVRTKRKITWDPAQKTILGDPEAAGMMHREMRAPWAI